MLTSLNIGSSFLAILSLLVTIYGAILTFSASLVLGVIGLFISPLFLVVGVAKLAFGIDLAIRLASAFGLH